MGRDFVFSAILCTFAFASKSLQVNFNRIPTQSYVDPYRGFERSGYNVEADVLGLIEKAQKRLWLAAYELRLPAIARALVAAHERGVDVKIVTENENNYTLDALNGLEFPEDDFDASRKKDYFAYADLNEDKELDDVELLQMDALRILKNAGIPIVDDTEDGSKGSGLMHHKFMLVDDGLIFTGSGNFTWSDFHGDKLSPESRGNANNFLRIDNPLLNQAFAEEFQILWGDGPGGLKNSRFGVKKTYRAPKSFNLSDGSKITLQFGATSKTYGWEASPNGLIAQELRGLKKSLKAAFFVWSEQLHADAVPARIRSSSQILIDSFFAYRPWSELLDVLGVQMLSDTCKIEAGNTPWKDPSYLSGSVRLGKGDLLHHKFAILDSDKVITGSHNWSANANQNNDEALLVIENPEIAAAYEVEFSRIADSAFTGVGPKLFEKIHEAEAACQNPAR